MPSAAPVTITTRLELEDILVEHLTERQGCKSISLRPLVYIALVGIVSVDTVPIDKEDHMTTYLSHVYDTQRMQSP